MSANIIITGFMGAGKTSVGKQVAVIMGRKFYDTDMLIIQKTRRSIKSIFAKQGGEDRFRDLERDIIREICRKQGIVISTGGGTLIDAGNREAISKTGVIFNLNAKPEIIIKRLSKHHDRPLLKSKSKATMLDLLKDREKVYQSFENQVDTSNKSAVEVAKEIVRRLRKFGRARRNQ